MTFKNLYTPLNFLWIYWKPFKDKNLNKWTLYLNEVLVLYITEAGLSGSFSRNRQKDE